MAFVPDKYVPVSEAGQGVTSRVYYCIPKHQVSFIKATSALTPNSAALSSLKRSIVAVKVSSMQKLTTQEYAALQAIRQSTAPHAEAMRSQFLDVKDVGLFNLLGEQYSYITLNAIDPPVTLDDLLSECDGEVNIPIPLVYHFFLSLVSAVLFLRDEVEWAHNDLKEDNIMCYLHGDSPFRLPEFIVIDFGMSYDISAAKNDSGDCKNALSLVGRVAEMAEQSNDQQWLDFKRRVNGENCRTRYQVDDEIHKIWDEWKDIAMMKRSQMNAKEWEKVKELFAKTAGKKGGVTNEMILSAVRN